jgi:Domain of unknown function (DUF397)
MEADVFDSDEFRKSSFSPPSDGGCVEVAMRGGAIGVRDSKHRDGVVLVFNTVEWDAFLKGVKAGEFDL